MSSISFDSDNDIYLLTTGGPNCASSTSSPGFVNDSTSSSSTSYTPEQLKQFFLRKDQNFRLEDNNSSTISSKTFT